MTLAQEIEYLEKQIQKLQEELEMLKSCQEEEEEGDEDEDEETYCDSTVDNLHQQTSLR